MGILKLFLENNGRSWTLKPNQECIIGSSTDCKISLSEEGIASQQLKFIFNPQSNLWYVYNLDRSTATYINNQPLTEYPITNQSRISVGNSLVFVATPEGGQTTVVPQSSGTISPLPNSGLALSQSIPSTRSSFSPTSIENTKLRTLAVVRYINRGFFDKEDPEKLRGVWLPNFSFSLNHNLSLEGKSSNRNTAYTEASKLYTVREDLYKEIYKRLEEYQKSDPYLNKMLHFRIIHYIDYQYQNDRDRIYLEIVHDTIRNIKITTLLRFFVNAENLYIGADSYALGRLKKRRLIIHCIILIFLGFIFLSLGTTSLIPFSGNIIAFLNLIPIILAIVYLYFTWINFIRALYQRNEFFHALRINFPKSIKENAFDFDDRYMLLKGIYPLIISSLEETLFNHDLLDKNLREILEEIRDKVGQTININTGGGGFVNSIIGGWNNAINNQSQSKL